MRILLLPLALTVLLAGCATDDTGTDYGSSTTTAYASAEPRTHPVHVGMTEGDVRGLYGDPLSIVHTAKGDIWKYWFNRSTAYWSGHARVALILFGPDGKVKDFVWNE
jgi:outer membrane protein assembly factor BamE (lipoprotein component of BamABCDE complex)